MIGSSGGGGRSRVAVVTGAAGGIGRAAALQLAREGAAVGLIDRDGAALEQVAQQARDAGARAHAAVADCSERASLEQAVADVRRTFGDPVVLVNNVGVSPRGVLFGSQTDFDELELLLAVNLKAAMYASRAVLDGMKQAGWGRIVNVSSDAAIVGDLASWGYASSKAALFGFTRALARELAPTGITVNAVAPGYTRTAMTEKVSEASRQRILAMVPMGQVIEPEDVAEAICFLGSDRARYVTGHTLVVNGGRSMG